MCPELYSHGSTEDYCAASHAAHTACNTSHSSINRTTRHGHHFHLRCQCGWDRKCRPYCLAALLAFALGVLVAAAAAGPLGAPPACTSP